MKKRIFAAVLCGVLIAGLAGCGNTAEKEKKENLGSTVTANITSDNEEGGDIPAESDESENPAASASKPQIPAEEKESPAEISSPEQTFESRTPAQPEEQKPASSPPALTEPPKRNPQSTEPPNSTESKPSVPDRTEVQGLTAQYINEYRSTPMKVLPGLTQVAEYRSRQLITNFSHDEDLDVCTQLQYGEYVDMGKYGYPEDSYYRGFNREAIAKGNWAGTADDIARKIAEGFKNSMNHWKYLGSDEYRYMAVGCTYDAATCMWYCCVCISSENYGG